MAFFSFVPFSIDLRSAERFGKLAGGALKVGAGAGAGGGGAGAIITCLVNDVACRRAGCEGIEKSNPIMLLNIETPWSNRNIMQKSHLLTSKQQ